MREHPDDPLLHYNLACYWSLAENDAKASTNSPSRWPLIAICALVAEEPDFDHLRGNPLFDRLVHGRAAPQA